MTIEQFERESMGDPVGYRIKLTTEDGSMEIGAHDLTECPEDATLFRDLDFVYEIPDLLRMAYEAGLRKETLAVGGIQEDDE